MELIRYKVKGNTVMGVLIDYNWGLGVYYTIENLEKMIPPGSYWTQLTYSPNRYEAVELWKTFNTCDMCRSEVQCIDAQVYGKLGRVCKSCIDKYCQFPIQRILFKKALARHLKAVKDTTCNCLFCRNLNTEVQTSVK